MSARLRFVVTIKCDNAAFDPDPEVQVADLLGEVATRIQSIPGGKITLFDVNGNRVGEAGFEEYEG